MRLTDLYNDEIAALYSQGLSDAEIGRELHIRKQLVRYWRLRQGLPPNYTPRVKQVPAKVAFGDRWAAEKSRLRALIDYEEHGSILQGRR
jgi:orotate phosphoribosyltransferase-like protein